VKKRSPLLLCSLGVLALGACLALVYGANGRAEAAGMAASVAKLPQFVTLSVDQRLVSVSWRCGDTPCTPWYLTRIMTRAEEARMYTLKFRDLDGSLVEYIISETRSGPAWPHADETKFLALSIDQRLVGISWVCNQAGCALSLVTRTMRQDEEAGGYLFTDGKTEYYIRETRE